MSIELNTVTAYELSNGNLTTSKEKALLDIENTKLKSRLEGFLSDYKLDLTTSKQKTYLKFLMDNRKVLSNIFN